MMNAKTKASFVVRARALVAANASEVDWALFWLDLEACFGKFRVEEAEKFADHIMRTLEREA